MHITERLTIAINSTDLKVQPFITDIDVVAASGLSAINENLGSLAYWAKFNGQQIEPLRICLRRVMVSKSRTKNNRAPGSEIEACVDHALRWWLTEVCTSCHGVKFQAVGQLRTMLICPACNGTGKKAKPKQSDAGLDWQVQRWNYLFDQTVNHLDDSISAFLRSTARKV
jgi:hypothetical protein